MRKITVLLIMILISASLFAVEVQGPSKIVLNYSVSGNDVNFKLLSATDSSVVNEIDFDDISALNHNESVYSNSSYHVVYSYSLPMPTSGVYTYNGVQYYFGQFRVEITCSGLKLNGRGDDVISATFVKSSDNTEISEWPMVTMDQDELKVRNRKYGDDFKVRLDNISGDALSSGTYTGVISVMMATE